jgi:CxxC motif-containing protein (DUF1111 family)
LPCHDANHRPIGLSRPDQCHIFAVQRLRPARHGQGLADGVAQGNATGRDFRTAPLWGAGQRLFFLHDGRTADLYQAILEHASEGSEANAVIANFKLLSTADKQALLNFLRAL